MSVSIVSRCVSCRAVINLTWKTCPICSASVDALPHTLPAPTHDTQNILVPPLQSGWLVAYRDRQGALRGGCDDRQHGTVEACQWDGNGWTLWLTDGQRMPLSMIRSVGQTDDTGQIVAAWTVREHGYDGEGSARDNR